MNTTQTQAVFSSNTQSVIDFDLDTTFGYNEQPSDELGFLSLVDNNKSAYQTALDDLPLLTAQQEAFHTQRIKQARSDKSSDAIGKAELSRQILIERNLRLVRSIARSYEGRGVMVDDLIQEGTIGLMEAIDKFDPDLGFRLSTYATYTIRLKIKRCVQDNASDLRLPLNVQDKIAQIKSKQSFLIQYFQREATSSEIAVCLALGKQETLNLLNQGKTLGSVKLDLKDTSPDDIDDVLGMTKPVIGLDAPTSVDQDTVLSDVIASPTSESLTNLDLGSLRDVLRKLLTILNPNQKTVLTYRYGLNGQPQKTHAEIAKLIHLSRERTTQIEREALEVLRGSSLSAPLIDFIG